MDKCTVGACDKMLYTIYVIGHLLQQLNSNRKANKEINYFIIERISDAEDSQVEKKSYFMYA